MQVKLGAKTYDCEGFGLTELADLQDWIQERRENKIIARAKKVYGDDLPDRIFDEISKEVSIDDLEDAISSDVKSIGYLIYLTVKKGNPNVTEKEVFENIGGLDDAMKALDAISPKTPVKKKPKQSKRRKPKSSNRKRS
jgi:hypothetical protein